MNKRIEELALEAEKFADWVANYSGKFHAAFTEKFAELIVQECINIVASGGEFASRPKLVEKLQEHFGIQE